MTITDVTKHNKTKQPHESNAYYETIYSDAKDVITLTTLLHANTGRLMHQDSLQPTQDSSLRYQHNSNSQNKR